jgi:hypothetical protein
LECRQVVDLDIRKCSVEDITMAPTLQTSALEFQGKPRRTSGGEIFIFPKRVSPQF